MADFFIADMHFGSPYRSYAKPRGFATVEAMHDAIVSTWRSRVSHEDTVWVLGDVGDLDVMADRAASPNPLFTIQLFPEEFRNSSPPIIELSHFPQFSRR